jgi:hypothetical protein
VCQPLPQECSRASRLSPEAAEVPGRPAGADAKPRQWLRPSLIRLSPVRWRSQGRLTSPTYGHQWALLHLRGAEKMSIENAGGNLMVHKFRIR